MDNYIHKHEAIQVDFPNRTLKFKPGSKKDIKNGAYAGAFFGYAIGGPAGAAAGCFLSFLEIFNYLKNE